METYIRNKTKPTKNDLQDIAKIILNRTKIVSGGKSYRICEIEFYLRCDNHKDEYTHCNKDQLKYGRWYFHQFANGSFKAGTFKGMDLTLGDKDNNKYLGILVRSLYDMDMNIMIKGPSNCVNELIGNHNESNVKDFMSKVYSNVGLRTLPTKKTTKNKYIYLRDYIHREDNEIYHGPRIGLSDKYPVWRDINYRFVVKKNLIIKQKRSLVLME